MIMLLHPSTGCNGTFQRDGGERERERAKLLQQKLLSVRLPQQLVCVCVCVCVTEQERERALPDGDTKLGKMWEREEKRKKKKSFNRLLEIES